MTNLRSTLFLFVFFIFQISINAQSPVIIKDIAPGAGSSNPVNFAELNGKIFFFANDGSQSGLELWRTDGTESGTEMLGDLNPDTNNQQGGFSQPFSNLAELGNELFFLSYHRNSVTGFYTRDFYKVNDVGAPELIKSIDLDFFSTAEILVFEGNLYWIQENHQIWKSDGTSAGTGLFYETSDRYFETINDLEIVAGELYFTKMLRDTNSYILSKTDIFKTNGTPNDIQFVKRAIGEAPTDCGAYNVSMFEFNGGLSYFLDGNSICSYESWMFLEGFDPFTYNHAPISGLEISDPVLKDGNVYFLYNFFGRGNIETNLAILDGNQAQIIKSFDGGGARHLRLLPNGNLIFQAEGNLWTSDGTEAGTREIRNFENGLPPKQFIEYGNGFLFSASELSYTNDFWQTDGTVGGTRKLASFSTASQLNQYQIVDEVKLYGNTLYFDGDNGFDGEEVYKIDLSQIPPEPMCLNNLLTNPGFEDGKTGWTDFGNVIIDADANSGNSAARLPAGTARMYQFVPAVPGKEYTLKGKAKTTEFVNTYIKFLTADWQPTGQNRSQRIYGNYSPFEHKLTAPNDAAWIEVSFTPSAAADLLLDDLCLSTEDSVTPPLICDDNLISNGDFEAGLSDWTLTNSGEAVSNPENVNTGTGAAKVYNGLNINIPNPPVSNFSISQRFSAEAGAEYELSLYIKAPFAVTTGKLFFYDINGSIIQGTFDNAENPPHPIVDEFEKFTYSEIAPPGTAEAELRIYSNPYRSLKFGFVDDVCVRKIADPQPGAVLTVSNVECPQQFPQKDRLISTDFTVKNTGGMTSVPTEIYLWKYKFCGFCTSDQLGSVTIPPLAPDEEITLNVGGTFPGGITGVYLSQLHSIPLDLGGLFLSFDNNNNPQSAAGLNFYCKKFDTDLEVEIVPVTTEYDVSGELVFKIIATNNGPATAYNTAVHFLEDIRFIGNDPTSALSSDKDLLWDIYKGMEWFPNILEPGESKEIRVIYQLLAPLQFTVLPDDFTLNATISSGHNTNTNTINDLDSFTFVKNTDQTGDEDNLTLTVVGDDSVPAWQNGTAYFEVTNRGGRTVNNIKLDFVLDSKVRFVGGNEYSASQGAVLDNYWTQNPTLTIPSIGPGGLAHVRFNLFSLSNEEIKIYGQITQASGNDPSSTPGNGTPPVPNEDDEAVLIFNGGGVTLQPDLTVSNVQIAGYGSGGDLVDFVFDLNNTGQALASGDYSIGAFLSTDPILSNDDIRVGFVDTGNTPIGTIQNIPGAVTIPDNRPPGDYYLILYVDENNLITESDENNNTSFGIIRIDDSTGNLPDLTITTGDFSASSGQSGALIFGDVYVKNQGSSDSGPFNVRYYLSEDATISNDDFKSNPIFFGNGVLAGVSGVVNFSFEVPGNLGSDFFLILEADSEGVINESLESNNTNAFTFQVDPAGNSCGFITNYLPVGFEISNLSGNYQFSEDTEGYEIKYPVVIQNNPREIVTRTYVLDLAGGVEDLFDTPLPTVEPDVTLEKDSNKNIEMIFGAGSDLPDGTRVPVDINYSNPTEVYIPTSAYKTADGGYAFGIAIIDPPSAQLIRNRVIKTDNLGQNAEVIELPNPDFFYGNNRFLENSSGDLFQLYTTSGNFSLYGIPANGAPAWRYRVAGDTPSTTWVDTKISNGGQKIYTAKTDNLQAVIAEINVQTGAPQLLDLTDFTDPDNDGEYRQTYVRGIFPTSDGGLLASIGYRVVGGPSETGEIIGKINSAGEVEWTQKFIGTSTSEFLVRPIGETSDGGAFFMGFESIDRTTSTDNKTTFIKTTADGALFPMCSDAGGDGADLELSFYPIGGSNPAQWSFFGLTLSLTNNGTEAASGIEVLFEKANEVVYKGGDEYTASQGDFNYYSDQLWSVGTLEPGETATLDVNYFRLSANDFTAFAQISNMNESDYDSTPGNGICCVSNEDDEAVLPIGNSSTNSVGNRNLIADNLDSNEAFAILTAIPNPVFDRFSLEIYSNETTDSELMIFDVLGKPVLQQKNHLEKGHNTISIDGSHLPSGFLSVKMSPWHPYLRQIRLLKMRD